MDQFEAIVKTEAHCQTNSFLQAKQLWYHCTNSQHLEDADLASNILPTIRTQTSLYSQRSALVNMHQEEKQNSFTVYLLQQTNCVKLFSTCMQIAEQDLTLL